MRISLVLKTHDVLKSPEFSSGIKIAMDSKIKDKNLVKPQDFLFGETEEDALPLDCGRKLRNVNIRYETYGKLDAAGSNAILILHALSGNAHVSGYYSEDDRKPGWWHEMVGPGRPT